MLKAFPGTWPNLEPLLAQLDRQIAHQAMAPATLAKLSGIDPATVSRFRGKSPDRREISLAVAICIGNSLGFDASYIAVLYSRDEMVRASEEMRHRISTTKDEARLNMLEQRRRHLDEQRRALDATLSWMDPFGPSRAPVGEVDNLSAMSLFKDEGRANPRTGQRPLSRAIQHRRLAFQRLLKRYTPYLMKTGSRAGDQPQARSGKRFSPEDVLAARHISLSTGPRADGKRDKIRGEIRTYGIGPLSRSDEELRGWLSTLATLIKDGGATHVTEGALLDEFKSLAQDLCFADHIEGGAPAGKYRTSSGELLERTADEESWLQYKGGVDGISKAAAEGKFLVPRQAELRYQRTKTLFRAIELEFFRVTQQDRGPGVRLIGNESKGLEISIVVSGNGELTLTESSAGFMSEELGDAWSPGPNDRTYRMIEGDVIVFPASFPHRYEFCGTTGAIVSINIKASVDLAHLLGIRTTKQRDEFSLG